ncbi:MAG: PAS domain S-box protein, partial [Candidatus Firestonebacteria bacterium]
MLKDTSLDYLALLSEVAIKITTVADFSKKMNGALALIGRHLKVSRVYIFIDNHDKTLTSNEFEWCSKGITPQKDSLQNIPYELIPSWRKLLLKEGRIYSEDINNLPADLLKILKPQGILSLAVYPLLINNKLSGFVGFDECKLIRKWIKKDLELLEVLANIIGNAYGQRALSSGLEEGRRNSEAFFDAIGDLVVVAGLQGNIIYTNKAVTDKLGYSPAELRKMQVLDMHPKDTRKEASKILSAMIKKELDHCPLELGAKNGSRLPVDTKRWFGEWGGQKCIFGLSRDLSAEQKGLQKFRKIFESNPGPMAISDISSNVLVDVNSSFLKLVGYARKEVLGKSSAALKLFPDPEKQVEVANALKKHGKIRQVVLQVRRKDGKILHGLFSGETINLQGKSFLLTGMTDVTEQIELKNVVETQKKILKDILKGTRQGTWVWNIKTGETVFNERWAEILGYSLKELAPVSIRTWERLSHPDDLVLSGELLKKHFEKKTAHYECEVRMKHKNGSWMWVADSGRVSEWDSKGNPVIMSGTHIDITENKLLKERDTAKKLIEKEISFGKLAAQMPGVLFQVKRSISGKYTVPEATASFSDIFGFLHKDVAENMGSLKDAIVKEDLAKILAEAEDSAKSLRQVSLEFRVQLPGKEERWIYSTATPEKMPDGSVVWSGYGTDFTDRKKEQELLNKALRLDSIGIAAGGIGHDFNN